jgi:hypothetical protein
MATEPDFANLLLNPNETLAHEFKGWLDLGTAADQANLAKAAIALANHGGGVIVLGMRGEENNQLESKERPVGIARYSPDSINIAINRYADPEMHCHIHFQQHPDTKYEHAFVLVGPSNVPVLCKKEATDIARRLRVYVRKDGPKSEEPHTAEDWRRLLDRCLAERQRQANGLSGSSWNGHTRSEVAKKPGDIVVIVVPTSPAAQDRLPDFIASKITLQKFKWHEYGKIGNGSYRMKFSAIEDAQRVIQFIEGLAYGAFQAYLDE